MNLIRRASATLPQPIGFAFRSFKSFRFPGDSLNSSSSSTLNHGVHIFQCPDVVGIVAKLSDCIASRGGNILGADVFVPEVDCFFGQMDEDFVRLSKMFNAMRSVIRVPDRDSRYNIAVLASKQCKVCMQTFVCTTTKVKFREHAEGKHPKSDVYTCFPHLKK